MADEELVKYLIQQSEEIEELHQKERALKEKLEEASGLPKYFGGRKQIIEELEAQHYFTKDKPGLPDDEDRAFRMFTQTTPGGDLLSGLVNERGQPATFIDILKTMDLRGLLWNYGVGWVSALKGGWNIALDEAQVNAHNIIDNVRKNVNGATNLKASYQYYDSKKQLAEFLNDSFRWNPVTNSYESVQRGPPQPYVTEFWVDTEDGPKRRGYLKTTPPTNPHANIRPYCCNERGETSFSTNPLDIENITVQREEYKVKPRKIVGD